VVVVVVVEGWYRKRGRWWWVAAVAAVAEAVRGIWIRGSRGGGCGGEGSEAEKRRMGEGNGADGYIAGLEVESALKRRALRQRSTGPRRQREQHGERAEMGRSSTQRYDACGSRFEVALPRSGRTYWLSIDIYLVPVGSTLHALSRRLHHVPAHSFAASRPLPAQRSRERERARRTEHDRTAKRSRWWSRAVVMVKKNEATRRPKRSGKSPRWERPRYVVSLGQIPPSPAALGIPDRCPRPRAEFTSRHKVNISPTNPPIVTNETARNEHRAPIRICHCAYTYVSIRCSELYLLLTFQLPMPPWALSLASPGSLPWSRQQCVSDRRRRRTADIYREVSLFPPPSLASFPLPSFLPSFLPTSPPLLMPD